MIRALMLIVAVSAVSAQTVSVSIASASGTPGGSVSLPVSLASNGVTPAGLQFSFSYTSDITRVTVSTGGAATGAAKSVSCASSTCVIYGLNTNVISDGTVVVATFQIASNPSTTSIPVSLNSIYLARVGG